MSRVESSKLTAYGVLGAPPASASASKIVAYAILVPGADDGVIVATRQGYCFSQKIRRG